MLPGGAAGEQGFVCGARGRCARTDVLVGAVKVRDKALLWFTQSQFAFMKDTKQRNGCLTPVYLIV